MKYRCIEECYPGHLIRVGDVVGEDLAFPRSCFIPIDKGTVIKTEDDSPKEMTNAEMLQAKANIPIAGGAPTKEEPEKKVVRRRRKE